jgi:hypothetical protein
MSYPCPQKAWIENLSLQPHLEVSGELFSAAAGQIAIARIFTL